MVGEVVRGSAVVVVDNGYTANNAENFFTPSAHGGSDTTEYNARHLSQIGVGVGYYTSTRKISFSYDNNCHCCTENPACDYPTARGTQK